MSRYGGHYTDDGYLDELGKEKQTQHGIPIFFVTLQRVTYGASESRHH